ncbi:hypothetical protein DSECCO2_590440 [anaerobic digester metagenome]
MDALCKDTGIIVIWFCERASVVDTRIAYDLGGPIQGEAPVDVDIAVDLRIFEAEITVDVYVTVDIP